MNWDRIALAIVCALGVAALLAGVVLQVLGDPEPPINTCGVECAQPAVTK